MKRIIGLLVAITLLAWASSVTARCRIEHREAYYEAMTTLQKCVVWETAYKKFSRDYDIGKFG